MRDKRELSSREPKRKGSRAAYDQDERFPRHESRVPGFPDGRDRDSPLPTRHRSTAVRAHDRERDRDGISYYPGRSSHASKFMSSEEAQKAIHVLFKQVKEATSFFASFKEEYQREVRGIEAYADQGILEMLWESRTKTYDSKRRSSKGRSKDDDAGSRSGFREISWQLWESLNDAYHGAISHPSDQNNSMTRKLDIAMKDLRKLLKIVQTKFQEMDSLIKELKVLKVVLELGGAGTASHDEKQKQRPRKHAAGHGHRSDSSPEREDVQYGGMGDHSGSEDNGQHDEQHGEHSERFGRRGKRGMGGDEEGQGVGGGDSWEE